MKFLVIGASGFVGRHILGYVRSLGFDSIGTESRRRQPGLVPFNLLEHRIGECVENEYFKGQELVIGVICSAISQIDRCREDQETSYKVNVKNTIRLVDDLVGLGARPVFLSSDGVFDGMLGYHSEEDMPSPINEYGRQKVEVEEYLQKVSGSVTYRLSKIVGDDPSERHLLSEWYHAIEENRPIVCIEGQVHSPTYVDDIGKGIVLGCQKGLSGLYHLANYEFFPREELARQFASALGRQVEIVCRLEQDFEFSDRRSQKTYLDSTKFVVASGMRFTSMREVFRAFAQRLGQVSGAEASLGVSRVDP